MELIDFKNNFKTFKSKINLSVTKNLKFKNKLIKIKLKINSNLISN